MDTIVNSVVNNNKLDVDVTCEDDEVKEDIDQKENLLVKVEISYKDNED